MNPLGARTRSLLLAAAVVGCAPVLLRGGFTGDDFIHVAYGKEASSPASIARACFGPFLGVVPTYLRPTTVLDLIVEGHLFGTRPFPYYLAGALLHGLASIFVAGIAGRVALRFRMDSAAARRSAFLAGLFFALNPSPAQAFAYIAGRSDLLAALFAFAALERWLGARPVPALLLYAASLGSKESAIVVAPAVALLELLLPRPEGSPAGRWRAAGKALALLGIPLAAYAVARRFALGPRAFPTQNLALLLSLGPGVVSPVVRAIAAKFRLLHFAAHPSVLAPTLRGALELGLLGLEAFAALRLRKVALLRGVGLCALFLLLLQGPGIQVNTDPSTLSMTRQFYLPSAAKGVGLGLLFGARASRFTGTLAGSAVAVGAIGLLANQVPILHAGDATAAMRAAVAGAHARYPADHLSVAAVDVPFNLEGVPFFVPPFGTPPAFKPPFAESPLQVQSIAGEDLLLRLGRSAELDRFVEGTLPLVWFHPASRSFTTHRLRPSPPVRIEWGEADLRSWTRKDDRLESPPLALEPGSIRRIRVRGRGAPLSGRIEWRRAGDHRSSGSARLRPFARAAGESSALLAPRLAWRLAGPIDRLAIVPDPGHALDLLESVSLDDAPDAIELLSPETGWKAAAEEPVFRFRNPFAGEARVALLYGREVVLARLPARLTDPDPPATFELRPSEGQRGLWPIYLRWLAEEQGGGWRVEVLDPDGPDPIAESEWRSISPPRPEDRPR